MAVERTEIPEDWTTMHWKQQAALAQALADDRGVSIEGTITGAIARATINGELNRRAQEDNMNNRSVAQPEIPEGEPTTPIKLIRDTWLGETRVRAEGQIVDWPLQDAKRLIKAGVAVRADPLPGE